MSKLIKYVYAYFLNKYITCLSSAQFKYIIIYL